VAASSLLTLIDDIATLLEAAPDEDTTDDQDKD